jgi:AraC-like DNA-binding protein
MARVFATMSEMTALAEEGPIPSLLAGSLRCDYLAGACTPIVFPHDTGWRTLPFLVVAQIRGCPSILERTSAPHIALADGDAISVRAGVAHRFRLRPGTGGESRWSHIAVSALGSLDPLAVLDAPLVLRGASAAAAGRANAALAHIAGATGIATTVRRTALAMAVLAEAVEEARPAPGALALLRAAQRLAPALAAIEARLADPALAPSDLAKRVGLSASRFNAVFRRTFGAAPALHIRRLRLTRAQQLLMGSDLRILDVAKRCGFGDVFHFSRLFKQYLGEAPQRYRSRAASLAW